MFLGRLELIFLIGERIRLNFPILFKDSKWSQANPNIHSSLLSPPRRTRVKFRHTAYVRRPDLGYL